MIERIKKIIQHYHLSISSFASRIGANQVTLNQQINGDRKISLNTVIKILDSFENISSEWLLKGDGPMWKEKCPGDPAKNPSSDAKTEQKDKNPKAGDKYFFRLLKEKDIQIARLQAEITKFQEQHDKLIELIKNLTKEK